MDSNYPSQFYNQETRRGFTISEVMKRSWAADMDMMISLTGICKQHSLRVFACYGTLLGAVREHGYIPWDDDIDIGLVRDDYIKLLDILTNEYSEYFNVLNSYTRSWYHMNFTHVTNSRSKSFERKYLEDWHGCPFMTGPDIYPYYYIPRDEEKEKAILGLLERIDNLIAMNRESQSRVASSGAFDENDKFNEMIATELVALQNDTGYKFTTDRPMDNQLEILYDQVCRVTLENEADYVCRYDEYCKDNSKKFPKEYFKYMTDIPFEQIKMPVPIGYDAVLKARFGTHYIVPRQENAAHDYPYYRKQLDDRELFSEQMDSFGKATLTINDIPKDNRKKVLYHTSLREMLIHADSATQFIKKDTDEFEKRKSEINYAWMPDRFSETDKCAMNLVAPKLVSEYKECIRKYIDNGGFVFGPCDDLDAITGFFDEYYGDDGFIAECFRKAGKTVTIREYDSKRVTDSKDEILKNKKKKKKRVLYISGISVLYQNKDSVLDKIRQVLKIFYDAKDRIELIWKAPVIPEDLAEAFGQSFVDEYNGIISQFKEEAWGRLTDSSDIDTDNIDAVYGDPDELMARFVESGRPIMIQNVSSL